MRANADAGLSVLELVVVLGVMAGLLVVVVSTFPRSADAKVDAAALAAFVSEARSEVILSGETGVLTITPQSMTFGEREISWSDGLTVTAVGAAAPVDYRLVLYPDGSYSGATLYVRSHEGSQPISGIYRSNPSDG